MGRTPWIVIGFPVDTFVFHTCRVAHPVLLLKSPTRRNLRRNRTWNDPGPHVFLLKNLGRFSGEFELNKDCWSHIGDHPRTSKNHKFGSFLMVQKLLQVSPLPQSPGPLGAFWGLPKRESIAC